VIFILNSYQFDKNLICRDCSYQPPSSSGGGHPPSMNIFLMPHLFIGRKQRFAVQLSFEYIWHFALFNERWSPLLAFLSELKITRASIRFISPSVD